MKRLLIPAALLIGWAAPARSQAATTVPPNDPVYAFIDQLLSAGLLDRVIVGQRPMSRGEVERILGEARRQLPPQQSDSSWIAKSLARYVAFYSARDTTRRRWIPRPIREELEFRIAQTPGRGIPADANGGIDVTVNPLLANRVGHDTASGRAGLIVGAMESAPTEHISLALTIRRNPGAPGDNERVAFAMDQLYARGRFGNVSVTLGRDYVFFGQGEKAGLTNSLNAGALDMVRVASDAPFTLPWLLRRAGPMQATLYVADLGARQNFPHARLAGYKVSARPSRHLEIGASVADQVGGQGAPGGTLLQKIEDAFPLIDALFLHRNFLFSNKFVGMDARLTLPQARGLQLYMEGMFDDFDIRRVRSVFTEDAGYIWGVSLNCFTECGPTKVTGEYHATGVRYYTHGVFTSGHTLNGQFIGNQLGPRGKAAYVTLNLDRSIYQFTVETAHEIRSGDKYGAVSTTPNDADFRFTIYEHNPSERRWRSVVTATRGHATNAVVPSVSAGVERVEHFNFQPGSWRTNSLFRIGVQLRFGPTATK